MPPRCGERAAEKRDELAPFQLIELRVFQRSFVSIFNELRHNLPPRPSQARRLRGCAFKPTKRKQQRASERYKREQPNGPFEPAPMFVLSTGKKLRPTVLACLNDSRG